MKSVTNDRAYYDVQGLQEIATADPVQALEQAAELFETQFLRMVLKNMRQAADALAADDNPFNSDSQRFYRDLYDEQTAQHLGAQSQLGLAKMLVKQFSATMPAEQGGSVFKPEPEVVAINSQNHGHQSSELAKSAQKMHLNVINGGQMTIAPSPSTSAETATHFATIKLFQPTS
ncbi:MAG: rod-binding protein [Plesiomonas sp.]